MQKESFKSTIGVLLTAIIVSLIVFVFGLSADFCFQLFTDHTWLAWLLPLFGLLTYGLYRYGKIDLAITTPDIITSIANGDNVSSKLTPAIFLGTCLSILGGGSVGKEAAALQIGASMASTVNQRLAINKHRELLCLCGMASGMAFLLACPLTATFFVFEITGFHKGKLTDFCIVLGSSFISFALALLFNGHLINNNYAYVLSSDHIGYILLLCLAVSLLSAAVSLLFSWGRKIIKHISKRPLLVIMLSGIILSGLLFLPGMSIYAGPGLNNIEAALNGAIIMPFFMGKMLFVIAFLSFGYKGGEIMPTMCIGATFGCFFGYLVGLDPTSCAMLGLVGMLSGCTNAPLACLFMGCELFGFQNIIWFVLASVMCFLLTMNITYYKNTTIYDTLLTKLQAYKPSFTAAKEK